MTYQPERHGQHLHLHRHLKRPIMRALWKEASFLGIMTIWTVVILGSPVVERRYVHSIPSFLK